MKNPYIVLFLILIANPVWADWTKVAGSENKLEIYIDLQTVRIDGNIRKVWQLTNYSTPQILNGQELLSMRARYEFDCKHDKRRSLTLTTFTELFAGGKSVETDDAFGDWKDIPPDSVAWDTMKRVCKAPAR